MNLIFKSCFILFLFTLLIIGFQFSPSDINSFYGVFDVSRYNNYINSYKNDGFDLNDIENGYLYHILLYLIGLFSDIKFLLFGTIVVYLYCIYLSLIKILNSKRYIEFSLFLLLSFSFNNFYDAINTLRFELAICIFFLLIIKIKNPVYLIYLLIPCLIHQYMFFLSLLYLISVFINRLKIKITYTYSILIFICLLFFKLVYMNYEILSNALVTNDGGIFYQIIYLFILIICLMNFSKMNKSSFFSKSNIHNSQVQSKTLFTFIFNIIAITIVFYDTILLNRNLFILGFLIPYFYINRKVSYFVPLLIILPLLLTHLYQYLVFSKRLLVSGGSFFG